MKYSVLRVVIFLLSTHAAHAQDLENAVKNTKLLKQINELVKPAQSKCQSNQASIVKVFDGKAVSCKNEDDFIRLKDQSIYSITPAKITKSNEDKFNIKLNIFFMKCIKSKEGYQLVKANSAEGLESEVLALRDGIYKPTRNKLNLHKLDQLSEIDLDINNLLYSEEKESLKGYGKVTVPVDFSINGNHLSGEKTSIGGAIRVFFELENSASGYHLSFKK